MRGKMQAISLGYQSHPLDDQFSAITVRLNEASDEHTALGTCIFAGGFSFGMEEAGFTVAGHLELPDLALGSHTSKQRWPVAVASLDLWKEYIDQLRDKDIVPDVFYANPPCVAYAGTGKHDGTMDSRMCYTRYCAYDAAMRLQPDVWMWELVDGVMRDRGFLDAMAFRAKSLGYRCYAFLTSSAIHGGYQDRRRFHFVASRFELDFEDVWANEPVPRRTVHTLSEALASVPAGSTNHETVYRGAFRSIFPFCPPGMHLRDVSDDVMREHYRPRGTAWTGTGRPGFSHTRARMDRPSPNVLGGHTIIHPIENRYLTPRECAAIMGFPHDYAFSHGAMAYAEIGRGLCTHNAAFLGRVVKNALERRVRTVPTRVDDSWMTVVDWRRRAKPLRLKMTEAEIEAWWSERVS
jgi:DNA (cytosine-5)-methyltransferase 1